MLPPDRADGSPDELVMPVHAEDLTVTKRRTETTVRVSLATTCRETAIDEALSHDRVVIERIPVGRIVDAVPAIREEDGTFIFPVVEEILVTEKRLILKEEVRVSRVRGTSRHVETVAVRTQDVTVTRHRAAPGDAAMDANLTSPEAETTT